MPVSELSLSDVRDHLYTVMHTFLGVMPKTAKKSRNSLRLKKLQHAKLASRPSDPARKTARIVRKSFESLGYGIADVSEFIVSPGNKTFDDLAKYIRKNHFAIFPR